MAAFEMKSSFRTIIALCATLAVIAVAGGLLAFSFLCVSADTRSEWQQPVEHHLARHMDDLPRDCDALLQSFRSARPGTSVRPEDLPTSLRVPGLIYALVYRDHLTLILYHSPDTDSGFRIWKSGMPADFADQATSIPFVTRFTYCDDYPASPANKWE